MNLQIDPPGDVLRFIRGGGEMGKLTRTFDWSQTPIGEPEQWPLSLRTIVGIILNSAFPMFLFWGEDLVCFYNDAYRPSLGKEGKHPALGKRGKEVWPEIWHIIGPLIEQVMTTGEPVWFEDQLIPIFRNGHLEDVYWTFSYSPAFNDKGMIDGVLVTCTETTEKFLNTRKLAQSEQNLRNTIIKAPAAMCILKGPTHVVEIANDRMIELWGTTAEQVLGKPIFEGLPEVQNQGYEELLDGVFTTGKAFSAQGAVVTVPRGDKLETVYVNFLYEALYEADGIINGVIVVALDVTELILAHKKLEQSEQRVRSLVESAPFPIGVYIGREMRIELANQSIIDVWGKGPDVIGKTYFEVLPELEAQSIYRQLDGVYTSGVAYHARNQRVDLVVEGQLRPFYFNYSFTPLFDAEGKVYGVMNTAADITDLNMAHQKVEQSERNFRNMIVQAPVAMCILLGPAHVVEVANELMIALWGKQAASVIGKPLFEGVPDVREQGFEQILESVYRTGQAYRASERPVEMVRKGRPETVYTSFVYEPYRDADGAILGILVIAIDVTDQVLARRKIEDVVAERTGELATANQDLQRSNAELAQFAYIASHDLQEPVRKVSTYAQMLDAHLETKDDRTSNYISKIKTSSSRMLALIRDVLAYSELSRIHQEYSRVNLQKVVEDIKTDFELLIEQKNAVIRAVALPAIEGIPLHLSQLFSNLVSNALKFSRPGVAPEITLTASPLAKEEWEPSLQANTPYYKIEVRDNGIGFQPHHAGQIFNIFQRLHGKKEYEGTGIGLAMCQKIVQNHHGVIYARSQPGQGSSFFLVLPERQEASHPLPSGNEP